MPTYFYRPILLLGLATMLIGCDGTDNSAPFQNTTTSTTTSTTTVNGVVFQSQPTEASIMAVGASGRTVHTSSDRNGVFQADVSSLEAPYTLTATGIESGVTLRSFAIEPGYININPITTSVLQRLDETNIFDIQQANRASISVDDLATVEKAVQQDLLVEIQSNGLNPETYDIFTTPVVNSGIGHNQLLFRYQEYVDRNFIDELTPEQGELLQRLFAKFLVEDAMGNVRPDEKKLSSTLFVSFYDALVAGSIEKNIINIDSNSIPTLSLDVAKNVRNTILKEVTVDVFITTFADVTEIPDADRIFLKELANAALSQNILRAAWAMGSGLMGKDTSEIYAPLQAAFDDSFLGNDRITDTGVRSTQGLVRLSNFMTCYNPLVSANERRTHCEIVNKDSSSQTINTQPQSASDLPAQQTFWITDVIPLPGAQSTGIIERTQSLAVEFNAPVYMGPTLPGSGREAIRYEVRNYGETINKQCDNIISLDDRSISCTFDERVFNYGEEYTVSIFAQKQQSLEKIQAQFRFSIPDYPTLARFSGSRTI